MLIFLEHITGLVFKVGFDQPAIVCVCVCVCMCMCMCYCVSVCMYMKFKKSSGKDTWLN